MRNFTRHNKSHNDASTTRTAQAVLRKRKASSPLGSTAPGQTETPPMLPRKRNMQAAGDGQIFLGTSRHRLVERQKKSGQKIKKKHNPN